MTAPNSPEAHALIILGEVRGHVEGLVRAQSEFIRRLEASEAAHDLQMKAISTRVSSLESYRTKVAGFTIGLAMVLTLTKDKLPALAHFITGV